MAGSKSAESGLSFRLRTPTAGTTFTPLARRQATLAVGGDSFSARSPGPDCPIDLAIAIQIEYVDRLAQDGTSASFQRMDGEDQMPDVPKKNEIRRGKRHTAYSFDAWR
jgi:hypothetical protein